MTEEELRIFESERTIALLIESSLNKTPSQELGLIFERFLMDWAKRENFKWGTLWLARKGFRVIRSGDRIPREKVIGQAVVVIAGRVESIDRIIARVQKMKSMAASHVFVFMSHLPIRTDQIRLHKECEALFCVNSIASDRGKNEKGLPVVALKTRQLRTCTPSLQVA